MSACLKLSFIYRELPNIFAKLIFLQKIKSKEKTRYDKYDTIMESMTQTWEA